MEDSNTNVTEVIALYNYFVQNFEQIGGLEKLKDMEISINTSGAITNNAGLNTSKMVIKIVIVAAALAAVAYLFVQSKKKGGMER